MIQPWKQYQEDTAEFFRTLGLTAVTDVSLQGVRTKHDVDVLVTFCVAGFEIMWVIECKHWQSPVTKLHVLGFREILSDLGADRGIILCESGFQSGAIEAAALTNVQVASLAVLTVSSKSAIYAVRLQELYDRTQSCKKRYWGIPKYTRIDKGLRFGTGGDVSNSYSGARVVELANDLIARAFRGIYPMDTDEVDFRRQYNIPDQLNSHEEVVAALEPLLSELESKLDAV
jgi:restriction system protein